MATGFWNTILPMVALCGLVAVLPNLFVKGDNLSQRRLAGAIAKTAVLTWIAGALFAALLYAAVNAGVREDFIRHPFERANFFLGRSALFAMLWAPVLGFVWLVKAQGINRRIGLKMEESGG